MLRSSNAMNTWSASRVFDMSSSGGSLKFGISTTDNNIDTEIFDFYSNIQIPEYFKSQTDLSGESVFVWEVKDINIVIPNNQYFIAEASWNSNGLSGHTAVITGCMYEE